MSMVIWRPESKYHSLGLLLGPLQSILAKALSSSSPSNWLLLSASCFLKYCISRELSSNISGLMYSSLIIDFKCLRTKIHVEGHSKFLIAPTLFPQPCPGEYFCADVAWAMAGLFLLEVILVSKLLIYFHVGIMYINHLPGRGEWQKTELTKIKKMWTNIIKTVVQACLPHHMC